MECVNERKVMEVGSTDISNVGFWVLVSVDGSSSKEERGAESGDWGSQEVGGFAECGLGQ